MRENPGTYSFIFQDTYLSRSGDSKRTFLVFESSCHLLLPFYPLKEKAIPLPTYNTKKQQARLFVSFYANLSMFKLGQQNKT